MSEMKTKIMNCSVYGELCWGVVVVVVVGNSQLIFVEELTESLA